MGLKDIFRNGNVEATKATPLTNRTRSRYKNHRYVPKLPAEPTDMVRGFKAAETGNMQSDWFAPTISTNEMLKQELSLLRGRCKERVYNDDYARAYVRMCVSNIVGPTGIRLQSIAQNGDGSRDKLSAKALESSWNRWAKYAEHVDVSGRENWKSILDELVSCYAVFGEVFIRHIEGKEDGGEYGYRIEVIDPQLCDETLNTTLTNGNRIVLGVEVNKWNKPVAYYFHDNSLSAMMSPNNKTHTRIEAKDIVHAYVQEFPTQVRGIPPMAVALPRLKMLSAFEEAALINARAGAAKMGFLIRANTNDVGSANAEDADGQLIDELRAGTITQLEEGTTFQTFDTRFPDGEIEIFKKSMLRAASSSLGVDYPTLGNDLEGVNFSSARVGIIESREVWKSKQQFVIDKIVTPVFERWLYNAMIRGMITVKSKPITVMNIEKYKAVYWIPRRWAWADPLKDTKSNIELMNAGIKSASAVAAELGFDLEEQVIQQARDKELFEQAGLSLVTHDSDIDQAIEDQQAEELLQKIS